MRRIITVVGVALVMGAVMLAMAMPAFAQPGGSENSCGIVGEFPQGQPGEFNNCGVKNNPNFQEGEFPPGKGLEGG
jgi:hypothetical protein